MNVGKIAKTAKKIKKVSDNVTSKINTTSNVTEKTVRSFKKNSAHKTIKSNLAPLNEDISSMLAGVRGKTDMPTPMTKRQLGSERVTDSDIKRFLVRFPRTAINFLDSSKEIIILAVWLAKVTGVKIPKINIATPAIVNKVLGTYIITQFRRLGDRELLELSLTFGSWMLRKKYFESEDDKFQDLQDAGYDELQTYPDISNLMVDQELVKLQKEFYLNKNEQFKLDSGLIFRSLDSAFNQLDDTPISLKYHKNMTVDVIDFILSVQKEVIKADKFLSDFDTDKLVAHYKKYN